MWLLSIELHSIAVKDICAINTFEKLLNILFSEVYCWHFGFRRLLFSATITDMSLYEVLNLFTRWPLVFQSFLRPPLVARDIETPATLSIMVFNICEKADLKVLFKLFGNTLLRFVSLENFTKATTFSNSNLIGKFYVNDNKEKVLTLSLSEVACSSHFATAPCQLQTLCFHQQDG